MMTGRVFFMAALGFMTPEATTPFPDFAVPYALPRHENARPQAIPRYE
eukprot:XP_001708510.1 Hypothetical protein GL50803_35735 [Giardia lamblia ATCC 50803]